MTLSQSQLLAISGKLLSEAREYSNRLTPGQTLFGEQYVVSCVLSSLALAIQDAYEAGKPGLTVSEERQYEGK